MEQKNAITLYESAAETIKTAILQGQYEALKGRVFKIRLKSDAFFP